MAAVSFTSVATLLVSLSSQDKFREAVRRSFQDRSGGGPDLPKFDCSAAEIGTNIGAANI